MIVVVYNSYLVNCLERFSQLSARAALLCFRSRAFHHDRFSF